MTNTKKRPAFRPTALERRVLVNVALAAEAACGELEWLESEPLGDREALEAAITTLAEKIRATFGEG